VRHYRCPDYQRRAPVHADLLQLMTDVIHHRGPDDGGVFVRGPIALGMRRLSIIDLEGGRQPFSNDTGRLQRRDLDRGDRLRDSHLGLHAR
jgi:asparagine synthetase B (glutamine-hydrolysing)